MVEIVDVAVFECHLEDALKGEIGPFRLTDLVHRFVNLVGAGSHVGGKADPFLLCAQRRLMRYGIPLVETSLLVWQTHGPQQKHPLSRNRCVKRLGYRLTGDALADLASGAR